MEISYMNFKELLTAGSSLDDVTMFNIEGEVTTSANFDYITLQKSTFGVTDATPKYLFYLKGKLETISV